MFPAYWTAVRTAVRAAPDGFQYGLPSAFGPYNAKQVSVLPKAWIDYVRSTGDHPITFLATERANDIPNHLKRILTEPPEGHSTVLRVDRLDPTSFDAHRQFADFLTVPIEPNRFYDGRSAFAQILKRGIVFTTNMRTQPTLELENSDLLAPGPLDLSDGKNIALHLFRLKNGAESDRQKYGQVTELFRSLMRQGVEVGLSYGRRPEARGSTAAAQDVDLSVWVNNGTAEYPLRTSGAG